MNNSWYYFVYTKNLKHLKAIIQYIFGNWLCFWDLVHADFMTAINRVTYVLFPRNSPNSVQLTWHNYCTTFQSFKCLYDYRSFHDVNKPQLNPFPIWWTCGLLPVLGFRNRVALNFSVYVLCANEWVSLVYVSVFWHFNILGDLLWELLSFNIHFVSYLVLLPVYFPENCLFHFLCFSLRLLF